MCEENFNNLTKKVEVVEMLLFLVEEISWLSGRVDSFPHGKLRPEENMRVNETRRGAYNLVDRLMEE